jgi:hypothetical protein
MKNKNDIEALIMSSKIVFTIIFFYIANILPWQWDWCGGERYPLLWGFCSNDLWFCILFNLLWIIILLIPSKLWKQ